MQSVHRQEHYILTLLAAALCCAALCAGAARGEAIRLAADPALSPNGKRLALAYRGDIWLADTAGGAARRLTFNGGDDDDPHFSPDGRRLAFVSDRSGSRQAYVVDLSGGAPRQLTFHSEGCDIQCWYPDGTALLVSGSRDHHWRHAERMWRVELDQRSAERPLFDAYGSDACLSPDGRSLLLVREGGRWWRLGYEGSRSAQIWRFDLETGQFTKLVNRAGDCRWPLWKPSGRGFYYVNGDHEGFDLWEQDLPPRKKRRRKGASAGQDAGLPEPRKLADMGHGSIVFPALSRNGSTLVFRHLGDLYRVRLKGPAPAPQKIELLDQTDPIGHNLIRRTLTKASEAAFTSGGLDMALVAGGDVWLMDTVLREPVPVTRSPEEESDVVFDPLNRTLLMVREVEGRRDIWRVERAAAREYWWRNTDFKLTQITDDDEIEDRLQFSADGKLLFYVRGRGELWVRNADGGSPRRLVGGFDEPQYDVSPDGKWIVYSQSNDNFNREVWLLPVDGSREPFNLSRHPDDDYGPRWSPDGKLIAFSGKRAEDEVDIYYVWLRAEDEETSARDRKLESALQKMRSVRGVARRSSRPARTSKVEIDFDGLHDRLHRVTIPDTSESNLLWSADSKRLAFSATVKGQSGLYTISIPGSLTPKLLTSTTGSGVRWLENGTLTMLNSGVPTSVNEKGEKSSYAFSARQEQDRSQRYQAAFDVCWRTMRDHWYDENLGNRNWDDVRRVYRELAGAAKDVAALQTTIELMLGELNGSHLGFRASSRSEPPEERSWSEVTAHLGVRFDPQHRGPGLRIRDVLPKGPAAREESRLQAGEVILEIDGQPVDPGRDLTEVLNGDLRRDIRLAVRDGAPPAGRRLPPLEGSESPGKQETREVVLRPISYSQARSLLYDKWLDDNRQQVQRLSGGQLGYLHIRAMNMTSFWEFERQLYHVGYGKDGLVIDVRENGGGSTTDLLLTALTQPEHAITVPRGGGPGYPQSRRVYATWSKPIIVLCNQNSFSNAEIFSHAIKGLGRGRLAGVPTAGGVISTGAVRVMDIGLLRLPFRGWFVRGTGEDMELNGAVPDVVVWPEPGELPAGRDRQLETAVELLLEDVQQWRQRPQPALRRATERRSDD